MSDEECENVVGGHWLSDLLGGIAHTYHPADPQRVLDQLNGKTQPKPGHQCSPYGYY
ncbi:Putative uncharacterized protein [Leuconostoc citreum LBAE C11]|nr:Putative uncharacterized protein [Leuconostoc citreum LBAE C11]